MTEPSPHYRQHHAVEPPRVDDTEFRPAWRKSDQLAALRDAREITPFEYACGLAFRHATEQVVSYAWPPPLWLGLGGGRRSTNQLAILTFHDEIALLKRVADELGNFACGLLEASVIYDFTWRHLGKRLGVDPRTVRAWTVLAIKGLARVFVTT
jgi:hypothetical protein